MPRTISLRPATQSDYGLALELYLTTMHPLTAELMPWDEARQIASFRRQWQVEEACIIQRDRHDVSRL